MKVELETTFGTGVANNSRPVILRIVFIQHDRPLDSLIDAPFLISESFSKVEIHLSPETLENPLALPAIDLNPLVIDLLDFKERELHQKFLEAVHSSGGHGIVIPGCATPTAAGGNMVLSGSGGALDYNLINSFYKNYNIIKKSDDPTTINISTGNLLSQKVDANANLSSLARNKLRLKL